VRLEALKVWEVSLLAVAPSRPGSIRLLSWTVHASRRQSVFIANTAWQADKIWFNATTINDLVLLFTRSEVQYHASNFMRRIVAVNGNYLANDPCVFVVSDIRVSAWEMAQW
jgi:hypothetical protein